MTPDSYFAVERVVFYVLAGLAVYLPGEWAICAYLLLTQCDLSAAQAGFSPTGDVGYANIVRSIVVPAILLYRLRKVAVHNRSWRRIEICWILLACYAAAAARWSPYQLPGAKIAVYLFTYGLLFILLTRAVAAGWVTVRALMYALWGSLLIGITQTYLFGNIRGSGDEPGFAERFTSFTSAPSYAEFLIGISILILLLRRSSLTTYISIGAAAIGIVLSGSRSAFVAALAAAVIASAFFSSKFASSPWKVVLRRVIIAPVVALCIMGAVAMLAPENRITELRDSLVIDKGNMEDVGTVMWRLAIYERTLSELSGFAGRELILGRGSGSGGTVKLAVLPEFTEDSMDASRVFHDEFLHAMYEWGLIGIMLLCAWYAQVVWRIAKGALIERRVEYFAALCVLPAITLSLLAENVLADAGDAGGTAFTLILAFAAVPIAKKLHWHQGGEPRLKAS